MKSLLIFIPKVLYKECPGYLLGKVVYDEANDVNKFYILQVVQRKLAKSKNDLIGFFSGIESKFNYPNQKTSNWISIYLNYPNITKENYNYSIRNAYVNNCKVLPLSIRTVIIIYDQYSMLKSELFNCSVYSDHFSELREILQQKSVQNQIRKKSKFETFNENILVYFMILLIYPLSVCNKISNVLLRILKYSTLGSHLNSWLENFTWMLHTVAENRRFTLKTGNLLVAMVLDVILGMFFLKLLLYHIQDKPPSQLLLDNAEKVVHTLQQLINWLMGSPAGLKLNRSLNNMLGKFFLYHIDLWWMFLTALKPVSEFAFEILLLFGRLGVTFQISIMADLLALFSLHTYCIYVYAARLFNVQLKGLIALFRLFLGKKKNPLRERVDSCQYQHDQLFIGTLFFTILLFLMPTTWVYYIVFTMLRLIIIALSGFLTRLRFYLQIMPVYTFFHWIFYSYKVTSSVNINMLTERTKGPVTLIATMVVSSWNETWKHCIPDTISICPSINWSQIVKNIYWSELLYPL